ncbi:hypothetical protein D9757_003050 [Collybiopsis confluens]|uniref:Uncharacterized protein n=1 Tax=Collybiopsis confluens TaxID=2823264 RepID=A0A8H5MEM8_9AGAR|nr:hypothetical protein D9757_003050 [Collybiopsis confluens]
MDEINYSLNDQISVGQSQVVTLDPTRPDLTLHEGQGGSKVGVRILLTLDPRVDPKVIHGFVARSFLTSLHHFCHARTTGFNSDIGSSMGNKHNQPDPNLLILVAHTDHHTGLGTKMKLLFIGGLVITKLRNRLQGNITEALQVIKSTLWDEVQFKEAGLSLAMETEIEEEVEVEDSLMADVRTGLTEAQDWTIELNNDCFDDKVV